MGLELDLGFIWQWSVADWPALLQEAAAIAAIIGLPLALIGIIISIRRPRWRKYRCRALPYSIIFRGEEYGYNPKTFLEDVKSVDVALKGVRAWYSKGTKPLLIRGVTGAGKSRLATEFIGRLGWRHRLWRKILMPTPHELSEMSPPFLKRDCILFLNDLHEFRDSIPDAKLKFYLESEKFKVIATIPTEKYDPSWSVLSKFIWDEMPLGLWTSDEGKKLADAAKMEFQPESFKGTPLSVLAPAAEMRRSYELLSSGKKAILEVLKVIKIHMGCFADYELISTLQPSGCKFDNADYLEIISKRGFWCKTYDSRCLLADGMEDIIPYQVSIDDAYRLQAILSRDE
jgi:hypothetical protein